MNPKGIVIQTKEGREETERANVLHKDLARARKKRRQDVEEGGRRKNNEGT